MSDLREQLMTIRSDAGRLTPEAVVTAASPEDHPLHSRFEWDDAIAGHQYRLAQAAELIRSVRVTYAPATDGAMKSIRQFHVVRNAAGVGAYEPIEEIVQDPVTRAILLRDMERDWRAMKERYNALVEFWDLVRADTEATA